jgi:hypothetical protein
VRDAPPRRCAGRPQLAERWHSRGRPGVDALLYGLLAQLVTVTLRSAAELGEAAGSRPQASIFPWSSNFLFLGRFLVRNFS